MADKGLISQTLAIGVEIAKTWRFFWWKSFFSCSSNWKIMFDLRRIRNPSHVVCISEADWCWIQELFVQTNFSPTGGVHSSRLGRNSFLMPRKSTKSVNRWFLFSATQPLQYATRNQSSSSRTGLREINQSSLITSEKKHDIILLKSQQQQQRESPGGNLPMSPDKGTGCWCIHLGQSQCLTDKQAFPASSLQQLLLVSFS